MNAEHKNFIIAVVLSMLIIFGWDYFYSAPQRKALEQQRAFDQTQTTTMPTPTLPGAAPNQPAVLDVAQALNAGPRVRIDTVSLKGSINLKGAQFDDLQLVNYREALDPTSDLVTLFAPSGTANGWFAEQGFTLGPGFHSKLPDSKSQWSAPEGAVLREDTPLTLTYDNGEGLVFKRVISLSDDYLFTIVQTIENKTSQPIALLPYSRIQRQYLPVIAGYWVFFEGMLGVLDGKLQEINYKGLTQQSLASHGGWLGFTDKYWATVIIPEQTTDLRANFHRLNEKEADIYQVDIIAQTMLTIPAGGTLSFQERLFAGAKVVSIIDNIAKKYHINRFDLMVDWGWFWFLTKPFFYVLEFIKGLVGNFGLAILVMTVLVKLVVFPLANRSYASMSRMKQLQPQMERIKELYPDDRMKQQQEMMALYKREKVSPLSGCLPILVQIPVFFSLYKVILTSIELRQAPFYGWIHDLSAADPTNIFTLFGLVPWPVPAMMIVGLWPIFMGITQWVQMRLNPTPPDPVQASLFNWMPVFFTFMMAAFPAGLVIYWTWSNLLSIAQQAYIMKRHGTEVNLFGNIRESLPFPKASDNK